MAKAQLKTQKNKQSVSAFVNGIKDPQLKKDAKEVLKLMKEITKKKPVMWGDSIVGFDTMELKYASGRELEWFKIGFSPRKGYLSIYNSLCDIAQEKELLKKLGKHKIGKSCLYINTLEDVHMPTLKRLLTKAYKTKVSVKK